MPSKIQPNRHVRRSAERFLALLSIVTAGCSQAGFPGQAPRAATPSSADRAAAARSPAAALSPIQLVAATDDLKLIKDTPLDRRIVVYTAGYKLVVQETDQALKEAEAIADQLGGYVQEMRDEAIVLRVPVRHYQDAIKRIEKLGQVASRELRATDVTEEYVDLEARLKNALAVRARLEALLAKAESVKAALEVEKELQRLGEEVETLQAKLELIKKRVAYSTISIQFERVYRRPSTPRTVKLPFAWLRELDPNRLNSSIN